MHITLYLDFKLYIMHSCSKPPTITPHTIPISHTCHDWLLIPNLWIHTLPPSISNPGSHSKFSTPISNTGAFRTSLLLSLRADSGIPRFLTDDSNSWPSYSPPSFKISTYLPKTVSSPHCPTILASFTRSLHNPCNIHLGSTVRLHTTQYQFWLYSPTPYQSKAY